MSSIAIWAQSKMDEIERDGKRDRSKKIPNATSQGSGATLGN